MKNEHQLLIRLDEDLAVKFKLLCVEQKISMREVIEEFIKHFVQKNTSLEGTKRFK